MSKRTDWRGEAIPGNESPETEILVWVITPGTEGFDECWCRDYFNAIAFAQDSILMKVDGAEQSDLIEHGVTVSMKLRRTTVAEYAEVQENEA